MGQAGTRRLAWEGGRVAVCSRDEERISKAATALQEETGGEVLPLVCDVTEEAQVKAAIAETVETFGGLHVLVTNAGGLPTGSATELDPAEYRDAVELNLMSTISLCDSALPHLRTAADTDGHARIVMVTSVSAKQPIPTLALSHTACVRMHGRPKARRQQSRGNWDVPR